MKILAIFTGGTIACSLLDGVLGPDNRNSFNLLEMFREKGGPVEFETAEPYFILSENLCAENLEALYECIVQYDLEKFDGVIVTQGTDTLQYTAAYLSLKLGLCDTPIVLVSSNFPLSDRRTNALDNFCGAVDFIHSGVGRGVFIAYKNNGEVLKIHRGTMVLPHPPFSDDIFSIFNSYYGTVEDGIFAANPNFSEESFEDMSACTLNGRVLWLSAHPGMVYPPLDKIKAVLLEGYHSGTINTSNRELKDFCDNAKEKQIPIFLTGSKKGFEYETKAEFGKLGITVLPPMSPICAYIKLWLS